MVTQASATPLICESTGPQAKGINMENAPRPKHFRPGEGAFDVPISKSLRRSSEDNCEHMGTHARERESCGARN